MKDQESGSAQDWLAVIDMQRVFGDSGSEWAVPRFNEVIGPCMRLVEAFADRVIYTRFLAAERPQRAWVPYYDRWPFALQPPTHNMWQLVEPFDAVATATLDANTFGKWGPQIAQCVGSASRLVLCGVSTDCCVLSTALAAADDGVEVLVAADACAGVDDDSHERALDVMHLYAPLITLTTVEEMESLLTGRGHAHDS